MARKAKVVGLSRDEDKNQESALVSCGLMSGRSLYLRTVVPRGYRVVKESTAASTTLYDRGASAMLSAVPLQMPRTDRQSILLLAYRNLTLLNRIDTVRYAVAKAILLTGT